jgi:hypothetical protein
MARIAHLLRRTQAAALALGTSVMLLAPATALAGQPWTISHWEFTELKPNIREGGRANTIAVHPKNNKSILVASESGGLFKSEDGGETWQHVDDLPVFYTNAVAFVPSDIVIVTASEDFSASNRGGIWRSDNGGVTWTQVRWKKDATSGKMSGKIDDGTLGTSPDPNGPCTARFSAYGISITTDGSIYVADDCGVSRSGDQGKTWTHVSVFAAGDQRVLSVLALPATAEGCNGHLGSGNLLLAGGPSGLRRSPDDGANWCEPAPTRRGALSPGAIWDMHALGRSPLPNEAYVVALVDLDESAQKSRGLSCGDTSKPKTLKPGETCGYMMLFVSDDGGTNWTLLHIVRNTDRDDISGCGGIAFVKAIDGPTSLDMYVSNRCAIFKGQKPRVRPAEMQRTHWEFYVGYKKGMIDAGDTRDIAFDSNKKPILVATDHGLVTPPDGAQLTAFAGAAKNGNIVNGFNALQIYQVTGQWISSSRHILYFGTQDNALWSWEDSASFSILPPTPPTRSWNEGGFFEGEYRVTTSSDSQITFLPFGGPPPPVKLLAAPHSPLFTCAANTDFNCGDGEPWNNPQLPDSEKKNYYDCGATSAPKIIRKDFHVQGVESVFGGLKPVGPHAILPEIFCARGLAVTKDHGKTWEQYATFLEDRLDLPKLSFGKKRLGPGNLPRPFLNQAIRIRDPANPALEIYHLARIIAKPCPNPSPLACVTYPLMATCPTTKTCPVTNTSNACLDGSAKAKFGSLWFGFGSWSSVFAVDPGDVNHLIAADVVNAQMMETRDGGDCWAKMDQLTDLVKGGGNLNFRGDIFFNGMEAKRRLNGKLVGRQSLQASAISFNPEHPDMVAVGTVQNGILISRNGGQSWEKVPGSERATLISALHWRAAQELIVATYGRGLWRVRWVNVGPIAAFDCNSPDCIHLPQGQASRYNEAVLAFGGGIEGARVANGVLRELFIRPGTSISFLSDSKEVPDIRVTETNRRVGFVGVRAVPRAPRETRIITGLTLRKSGRGIELAGFVFGRRPLFMRAAAAEDQAEGRPVGRRESPNAGQPYLELLTGTVGAGGAIRLAGRNLEVGSTIEIAIDDRTVQNVVVGRDGRFSASVNAPLGFGLYRVTIVDATSKKVLDGASVTVRPEN